MLCAKLELLKKGDEMSDLTKEQLDLIARGVLGKFLPYAFSCSCNGNLPECAEVINDEQMNLIAQTLFDVTDYIRNFDGK